MTKLQLREAESHSQRGRVSPLLRLPGPSYSLAYSTPEGPVTPFTLVRDHFPMKTAKREEFLPHCVSSQ